MPSGWRLGIRRTFGLVPEDMVRPFVSVDSFSRKRTIVEPREIPESFFEAGGPSQFSYQDTFRDLANGGRRFRTNDPPPGEDEPERWREQGRDVTEVRVENPDDPDQFVIVERIDKIRFQGPDGRTVQYELRN